MRQNASASKIRFTIVLPVMQVVVTAILTWWADRVEWMALGDSGRAPGRFVYVHLFAIDLRQIWRGVNAPALPFSFAGYAGTGYQILGFGLAEVLYFAGVALVWWLVGGYLDRRRLGEGHHVWMNTGRFAALVLAWGMILLGVSFSSIGDSLNLFTDRTIFDNLVFLFRFRTETLLKDILFLLWSVVLIVLPGAKLARAIRRKHAKGYVPD